MTFLSFSRPADTGEALSADVPTGRPSRRRLQVASRVVRCPGASVPGPPAVDPWTGIARSGSRGDAGRAQVGASVASGRPVRVGAISCLV